MSCVTRGALRPQGLLHLPKAHLPLYHLCVDLRMTSSYNKIHDVVAWLQICELGPDGQYAPVPVISQSPLDPGAFSLHQGLQRRITLSLSSNSGQQLPWIEFTKMRLGNVRLLDPKGRVHESSSKAIVTLPLLKEQDS
jgi:kinesin family protein 1